MVDAPMALSNASATRRGPHERKVVAMKTLIALAAAAAILSSTGCCWPMHEGRHYRYGGWSDDSREGRPPPASRGDRYRR
jgi:hypothetical protein